MGEELFHVIQAADMDLRADFYKHIVLSGACGGRLELEQEGRGWESALRRNVLQCVVV